MCCNYLHLVACIKLTDISFILTLMHRMVNLCNPIYYILNWNSYYMDNVKEHFEKEASEFDGIIQKLIPYYDQMLNALIAVIPFPESRAIHVIDLGCGTGTIALRVKTRFPQAKITCMDIADNMLEMARLKLEGASDIQFVSGNFETFKWPDQYDLVVSSLALHHLVTDDDKKRFYRAIYDHMRPEGLFVNADVVLGADDAVQAMYMEKWKSFMLKQVSPQEIDEKWIPKYNIEDRPVRLTDHIQWLQDTGFSSVDVVWKYYNYTVYCAKKTV